MGAADGVRPGVPAEGVRRIVSVGDATALARRLAVTGTDRPTVVLTIAGGHDEPFGDAAAIKEAVGDLADVVLMPTSEVSWAFTREMPGQTQVYGGAGRVYPAGFDWVNTPSRSPLRFAYSPQDRARITEQLINDALESALAAGLLPTRSAPGLRRRTGRVSLIIGSRAVVTLDDGVQATVWEELTLPGVALDRLLHKNQQVTGVYDPASRRLDLRQELTGIDGPGARDAVCAAYAVGDVVLAEVADVGRDTLRLRLLPGLGVDVTGADVTSNENDALDDLVTRGEVVLCRFAEADPPRLRLDDIDDDAVPVAAPALLPGGPPWLTLPTAPQHAQPAPAEPERAFPAAASGTAASGTAASGTAASGAAASGTAASGAAGLGALGLGAPGLGAPGLGTAGLGTAGLGTAGPEQPEPVVVRPKPSPAMFGPARPKPAPSPTPAAKPEPRKGPSPLDLARRNAPAAASSSGASSETQALPAVGDAEERLRADLAADLAAERAAHAAQLAETEDLRTRAAALEAAHDRMRREIEQLKTRYRNAESKRQTLAKKLKAAAPPPDDGPLFLDPAQQFAHDLTIEWARRIPAAEKDSRPLAAYTLGPDFLTSVRDLEGVSRAKILAVVVEVLTDRLLPGRERHRLRTGAGGNSPHHERDDGATCWRVALQQDTPSARRLHYWRLGDRYELSRVCLHDTYKP